MPALAPPPIVRVAILLPLSGPDAELGQALLDAAQMAVFDRADAKFALLPADTEGTPDGARRAAAAVLADGAALILGPLFSESDAAIAPLARAANVRALSFSTDRSVAGDGVFVTGFLPGPQIARLVFFARRRGILRIAALVPDNVYGQTVLAALDGAAQRAGVAVTRIATYAPDGGDIDPVVRRFADYDARRRARAAEGEAESRESKRPAAPDMVTLPFDAVLLPEGGDRLRAIAPRLPFYDVDPSQIRFLGTGQWDDPSLKTEPALFGGWFVAPPPAARAEFQRRFQAVYGRRAPEIATLGYDITALAAVLAQAPGRPDFSAEALTAPNGFSGTGGIFRLLPDGGVERGLAVVEIGRRGFRVIDAAPVTFEELSD